MITFTVPGNPKTLKRHRTFRTKGGFNVNVDPNKNTKADFLAMAMQHRPDVPFEEPIRLFVKAYFPRPKAHYLKSGLRATAPVYHTGTPDADNILKFVGDALNGIFWKDDKFIASASIIKQYTETAPRIIVEISQLNGESNE